MREKKADSRLKLRSAVVEKAGLTMLVVLTVGCETRDMADAVAVRDSAGVTIAESTRPKWVGSSWTIAQEPRVTIGVVDGPEEYQFTRIISVLRLPDSRIVAANFTNPPDIRIYSEDGHHLLTIGRSGAGPGEFQAISWIDYLPSDTLRVFDFWQERATYFDLAGNLLATTTLSEVAGMPLSTFVLVPGFTGGDLLARFNRLIPQDAQGRGRALTPLIRVTRTGAVVDTIVTIPDAEYYVSPAGEQNLIPFGPRAAVLPSADRLFVSTADAYRIDEYTSDGLLRQSSRRLDSPRRVHHEDVVALLDQLRARVRSNEERAGLDRWYREVPHVEVMPAYDRSLLLDAAGNVWARQFSAPLDSVARWDVFDGDGAYLAVVTVPLALNLVDVGSNDVLGVWRDELGVESLRVYELRKRP